MNKTRRIILLSAKSNINEQITGLRLGASVAYITKPFNTALSEGNGSVAAV